MSLSFITNLEITLKNNRNGEYIIRARADIDLMDLRLRFTKIKTENWKLNKIAYTHTPTTNELAKIETRGIIRCSTLQVSTGKSFVVVFKSAARRANRQLRCRPIGICRTATNTRGDAIRACETDHFDTRENE